MTKEQILLELSKTSSQDEKISKMIEILEKAKESNDDHFKLNALIIAKEVFE